MRFGLTLAALAVIAAPAAATPSTDLAKAMADHWQWALNNDPFLATEVGDHRGDGRLPDASLAAADRTAAAEQGFIDRLDHIDAAALTAEERVNKGVLRRMLADDVEGNKFGQRAITFTTYSGWHTGFAGYPDQATLQHQGRLRGVSEPPRCLSGVQQPRRSR